MFGPQKVLPVFKFCGVCAGNMDFACVALFLVAAGIHHMWQACGKHVASPLVFSMCRKYCICYARQTVSSTATSSASTSATSSLSSTATTSVSSTASTTITKSATTSAVHFYTFLCYLCLNHFVVSCVSCLSCIMSCALCVLCLVCVQAVADLVFR